MSVVVACPHCGHRLKLRNASPLGRTGRCRRCDKPYTLRRATAAAPKTASPQVAPIPATPPPAAGKGSWALVAAGFGGVCVLVAAVIAAVLLARPAEEPPLLARNDAPPPVAAPNDSAAAPGPGSRSVDPPVYTGGRGGGSAVAQPVAPLGRRVALLVGVNVYDRRGYAERPLRYAERDMTELRDVLTAQGFEVRTLLGSGNGDDRATKGNFQTALDGVLGDVKATDTVLLAFAGHGEQLPLKNDDGSTQRDGRTGRTLEEAYFVPVDAARGEPETLIGLTGLMTTLDRRGGVNLILVDACRDNPDPGRGRSISGNELDGRLPSNTALLFACSAGQEALETPQAGGGHGVFFHCVIEGLEGAAADPATGTVGWDELTTYVRRHVDPRAKEWFPQRAEHAFAGRLQSPHELRNLVTTPRLVKVRLKSVPLVVAAHGGGDFTTIPEALAAAPIGGLVSVKPGTYRGAVVVNRPVTLEGDGPKEAVVIEADDDHALTLAAPNATIRNFTIRCTAERAPNDAEDHSLKGLRITAGRPVVEDCAVNSRHGSCVGVENRSTAPVLRRVVAADGQRFGFAFEKKAAGTVINCHGERNGRGGIGIASGASADVAGCRFNGNKLFGINVHGAGTAPTFRNCVASRNESAGLAIALGASGIYEGCTFEKNAICGIRVDGSRTDPTVRDCTVSGNREGSGLAISSRAAGTYEECRLEENGLSGIDVWGSETAPTIRNCTALRNSGAGLAVVLQASGTYEGCTFDANKAHGIHVRDSSTAPTIRDCVASDNQFVGLNVVGEAGGIYERCTFEGNEKGGIASGGAGTTPTVRDCVVSNTREGHGVLVYSEASGSYVACTFEGNGLSGMEVRGTGTSPTVRDCVGLNNQLAGLVVVGGAGGSYEGCTFKNNKMHGIEASGDGTAPTVHDCVGSDNHQLGLHVCEGASGTYDSCAFERNKVHGIATEGAGTAPTISGGSSIRNEEVGVAAFRGARPKISGVNLRDNGKGAWHVDDESRINRSGNHE